MIFSKNQYSAHNQLIRILIFVWGVLLMNEISFGQETITIKTGALQNISEVVEVLEDHTASLNISTISSLSHQAKFHPIGSKVFSRPPSASNYWFKVVLENKSRQDLWLELGRPFGSWLIDVYLPDSMGQYSNLVELGALRLKEGDAIYENFIVKAASASQVGPQQIFIKVSGHFPATHIFRIGGKESLQKRSTKNDYATALFIGVMLSMLLYNLFLFFSTKEQLYLIYVSYSILILFTCLFESNHPFLNKPWLWTKHFVWHNFVFIAMSLLAFKYLEIKKIYPKIYWWLLGMTVMLSGVIPLLNLLDILKPYQLANLFQPCLMLYYLTLLSLSLFMWAKGYRRAKLYAMGWSFLMIAAIGFILTINGILPINIITENILYIGVSLEAIMFAWALGDRMNLLKREKEEAQSKNLQLVKKQKEILEQKVIERTKELQESYDEIQAQKEELHAQKEEISVINDALEQKVQARTKILERQRNQLKEYAFANSHKVRGPLARMLGLIYIIKQEEGGISTEFSHYIDLLAECSEDMDEIIKAMNRLLETVDFEGD